MNNETVSSYPRGLPYLFLTEMWERFGFYVVQGMLVLYMSKFFGFSDDASYNILGTFTALAYISSIIGGILADRLLGFKLAITLGGFFLSFGYGMLALPIQQIFYFALATIIVGNGLFKPNISSLLGALYGPHSTGRDVGFTIFYVGLNLGVLLAGLSSGFIKDHFGWHAGFALACAGLLLGLAIFSLGIRTGAISYDHGVPKPKNFLLNKIFLIIYCILAILCLGFLLDHALLNKWFFPILGVFLLFFMFSTAYKQKDLSDRNRLTTLNLLIISSIIFWAIYWQIFFSVTLFIERLIDKHIFGVNIPTTVFYSLESVFVIFSGPILAWFWQILDEKNCNPSSFMKFVLGIGAIGVAFLVLWCSTGFVNATNLVSPLWIVIAYLLITLGEMCISPIGLSAVTMLSPRHLTGMMMGIWFVALGFGGKLAGWLATWSSIPDSANTAALQLPYYRHAFLYYSLLAFVVMIVLFFVQKRFNKNGSNMDRI